ncbi:carboxylating nicotinate-nucleotide diphosphorylase [bacterium]|nr:carboxylating nicotinate-nucleotide diphosphorylase [candidate division CSSED10-310 bacterium]
MITITKSPDILQLIELAIREDLSLGDITSDILIPKHQTGKAVILSKAHGILCGQEIAEMVFARIDQAITCNFHLHDSDLMHPGDIIADISGPVHSILSGERIVLNFLQRLSGIASFTHQATTKCKNTPCRISDTRKTTPGWRILQKYAVACGGGANHRICLGDGILIKDNHIRAAGGIAQALKKALKHRRHLLKVQIEVTTPQEAHAAVENGAEALLLDNMSPEQIQSLVNEFGNRVFLEASGNINETNLESYARTGVNLISMGALTHSFHSLDISLEVE